MDFEDFSFLQKWQCYCLMFPVVFAFFWTWVGACIGSFLNVCVWRIPNGMSLLTPPSHCPNCNHRIPFYENIPIFSWLFLRGKCSKCHCNISPRYIIVETLTACMFLGIWESYVPNLSHADAAVFFAQVLLTFFFAGMLISAAFTDCDYHIIPDEFPITFAVVKILLAVLLCQFNGAEWFHTLWLPVLQAIGFGLFLSYFAIIGKKIGGKTVFGWGDVKLISVMALFFPIVSMLWMILIACVVMMLFAPIYRKIKPKMRNRGLPFAPALAIAAAITFFFEAQLIRAFLWLSALLG